MEHEIILHFQALAIGIQILQINDTDREIVTNVSI